jgi:uncharacterized protein YecE (DUF72 family)
VNVRVGTSGWNYPEWKGSFYPRDMKPAGMLAYYAERFSTVEVNNTFYRLPPRSAFEGWAARTPDDFVVVVKASRYLSHVRRLNEPEEPVARLLERAAGLGSKLGPVLLQLPPTLRLDLDRLDRTLASFGPGVRVVVEPRHQSWFADETYAALRRRGAALCLTDRRNRRGPVVHTSDWAYVRLHEGTATPAPCYGDDSLRWWVRTLVDARDEVAEAWVFFNNDPRACALANARRFAHLCDRAGLEPTRVPTEAVRPSLRP